MKTGTNGVNFSVLLGKGGPSSDQVEIKMIHFPHLKFPFSGLFVGVIQGTYYIYHSCELFTGLNTLLINKHSGVQGRKVSREVRREVSD